MSIEAKSPAGRDAIALIGALDAYLLDLYPRSTIISRASTASKTN
jgi:hypothetical protein